jgi:predicted O-methyltransferase YrrM
MATNRILEAWEMLFAQQGNPNVKASAITPHEAALLYGIVRAERPHHVLEIGTGYGFSTAHIAEAIRENGHGHLVSVDPDDMSASDYAATFIKNLQLNDCVTFVKGKSPECLFKVIAVHPKYKKSLFHYTFGFAFIDGDHSEKGLMADYDEVVKFMALNGKIVIHDTKVHIGPANLLINAVRTGEKVISFNTERGMALIQVKTA